MHSRFLFLVSLIVAGTLHAQAPLSARSGATRYDTGFDAFYAGKADIYEGTRRVGEISTTSVRASFVTAVPVSAQDQFLAGFGGQWLGFDAPAASLVPDELSAVAAKLGWNHTFDARWTFRGEIDPGVYGAGSFGAPVALRAIYAASRELQWAFAVNYDWRSQHPLLGGVGVRWVFAPDWTLALLFPAPRIEWALTREITLTAGVSLRGGTFKVGDDFGRRRGRPAFDGQTVDYREITVGAGVRWQFAPGATLTAGVGATTDRRFEFDDRNLLLNGDGAPAFQLTLTSAF